jgi:hypothetical protein
MPRSSRARCMLGSASAGCCKACSYRIGVVDSSKRDLGASSRDGDLDPLTAQIGEDREQAGVAQPRRDLAVRDGAVVTASARPERRG